jgi:hypothetical protein
LFTPDVAKRFKEIGYFDGIAIMATKNSVVLKMNNIIAKKIPEPQNPKTP